MKKSKNRTLHQLWGDGKAKAASNIDESIPLSEPPILSSSAGTTTSKTAATLSPPTTTTTAATKSPTATTTTTDVTTTEETQSTPSIVQLQTNDKPHQPVINFPPTSGRRFVKSWYRDHTCWSTTKRVTKHIAFHVGYF